LIKTKAVASENFKLRFRDTYIRAWSSDALDGWEGDGPSYSRRGIYLAEATTVATSDDEQSLVSLDGSNSEIPISIYCFSGPNDAIQPFALYNATVIWKFERDVENDLIYMSGTLFSNEETGWRGGAGNVRFQELALTLAME